MNDEVQTEEQALASVLAGYNQARGDEPPAQVEQPSTVQDEPAIEDPQETPEKAEPAEELPTVTTLADELKALKAKVAASTNDPDTVRKMHGEIGNINRTLQQLQAKPAPVDDELTAAIAEAEKVAEEYPELAGPLVKALKTSMARGQQPVDIDERVTNAVAKIREAEAMEALQEEHPDYITLRDTPTPEYKAWLAGKTPEFQDRFLSTWNPAVVSRGLTEFKDSLKARERKQNRLASAVVPQSTTQKAEPSAISDEEALYRGYNSGPKRRIVNKR